MKTWEMIEDGERILCEGEEQCYSAVEMIDRALIVYGDVSDPRGDIIIVELPIGYSLCKLVDTAPEQPKADWSQAPDWANWWSVDADGMSYWSQREPHYQQYEGLRGMWQSDLTVYPVGRRRYESTINIPLGIDWRLLKEERPR